MIGVGEAGEPAAEGDLSVCNKIDLGAWVPVGAIGVSALTGCLVIGWFLHYLRRSSLRPFVYYRVIFGIIVLALAFIRRPA